MPHRLQLVAGVELHQVALDFLTGLLFFHRRQLFGSLQLHLVSPLAGADFKRRLDMVLFGTSTGFGERNGAFAVLHQFSVAVRQLLMLSGLELAVAETDKGEEQLRNPYKIGYPGAGRLIPDAFAVDGANRLQMLVDGPAGPTVGFHAVAVSGQTAGVGHLRQRHVNLPFHDIHAVGNAHAEGIDGAGTVLVHGPFRPQRLVRHRVKTVGGAPQWMTGGIIGQGSIAHGIDDARRS